MLNDVDADLAGLFGVTTSRLNEQVKRNQDRFPDDFMFRLTTAEFTVRTLPGSLANDK